jgi:POT family proton-dependent oligopeptide transporter
MKESGHKLDHELTPDEGEIQMFGHPKGLFYLFFAEMWERFSFYGMRALLVLYLSTELFKDLSNGEEIAFEIYAAYGALVYFTPAIGGMIADRMIGHRNSIMLGGILMCIGHFTMAFENESIFYLSLGLLIVGNGFFKPNISSLVGSLYKQGDEKRDAGFTIFYMGINLGAFLSPLVCGWLGHEYGWHYGFAAAGVGMLLGIIVFYSGTKNNIFGDEGNQPETYKGKKYLGLNIVQLVYVVSFLAVPLFAFLVSKNSIEVPGIGMKLMETMLWSLLLIVLVYLVYISRTKLNKVEIKKLGAILILTFFVTIFWSFFEQAGSSLTLFAEKNVDLVGLNAAQTNSINAGYIVLLAIPFSIMWTWLDKRKKNPSTPVKFGLGILQLGIGFIIFAFGARYMNEVGLVPMVFLMLGYLLITTGELFASPIGLSKVTQLSPAFLVSFMMGVWFLSSSFAHHISGVIAKLTIPEKNQTEFVVDEGFMTSFATWASGTDQNKVGEFNFEFESAVAAIEDTVAYSKTINYQLDGNTNVLTASTFSEIDAKLGKLPESIKILKDTIFTRLPEKIAYPKPESLTNYFSALGSMKNISDVWSQASDRITSEGKELTSSLSKLGSFDSPKLKSKYIKYKKVFLEKSNRSSFEEAYDLLVDPSQEDFEKKIKKVSPKWKINAENLISLENNMRNTDKAWAEAVFSFSNKFEANKRLVSPVSGLAVYAKVFAQIGLISFFFALLAFGLSPMIKNWMGDIH